MVPCLTPNNKITFWHHVFMLRCKVRVWYILWQSFENNVSIQVNDFENYKMSQPAIEEGSGVANCVEVIVAMIENEKWWRV